MRARFMAKHGSRAGAGRGLAPWTGAALVGATAALSPNVAAAQDAPAAEEEAGPAKDASNAIANGNDIIVTATKREQRLQNVAVAVAVVPAATIELAHIRDIADLATLVPSLRVLDGQSSGQTAFTIRGFGNGITNAGIEPSVGMFIDGVYRSRSAAQIEDLPDMARVEVLRGPQSTLFGKNASAGVINIATPEPKFKPEGFAELSYGNYNALIARGMVSGALSKDVAVSIAGSYNRRDGTVLDAATGARIDNRNRWSLRGQLLYEPNTQLKVRVIGDYGRITELCCATIDLQSSPATAAPFANVINRNFDPTNGIKDYGLSAQVDYSLGPLTVTSISAWRQNRNISNIDADFTSADLIGRDAADVRVRTFTQELRAATNMEGPLNFIAGAYYSNERIGQTGQILLGQDFRSHADLLIAKGSGGAFDVASLETALGALQGNPNQYAGQFFGAGQGLTQAYALQDDAISIFGQVDFKPLRRLTLTAGVNYTHDGKHFSTHVTSSDVFSSIDLRASGLLALKPLQILPPFLNVPNAVEPGRTEDGDIAWTARASFDPTPRLKLYGNISTGFKASSIDLSQGSRPALSDAAAITAAGLSQVNQSYGTRFAGPEHAMLYEAGLKGNWGVATLNFAIFKQYVKGFQTEVFNGTGFALVNAQKESVAGFEFEGVVQPVAELTLSQSLTYLHPRYDRFTSSSSGDISGTTPAGIPPIALTAAATWDHPFANGDHVILRADWHYKSPTRIADGVPGEIAAARPFTRTVSEIDSSLMYHLHGGLEVGVWGRNMTDNRYITEVFDATAQAGAVSGYLNQPRSYGVSALCKF